MLPRDTMVPAACLALLLAGPPAADVADARAQLNACAERIEELKAQRRAGQAAERELERLLVRAQELALALEFERMRAAHLEAGGPPALDRAGPPPPSPEELRERADAARDEADRLAAVISELDVKLGDARRMARAESDPTMARAALGSGSAGAAAARVRELQLQRTALAHRRAAAEHAAAKLEEAAQAAEVER